MNKIIITDTIYKNIKLPPCFIQYLPHYLIFIIQILNNALTFLKINTSQANIKFRKQPLLYLSIQFSSIIWALFINAMDNRSSNLLVYHSFASPPRPFLNRQIYPLK